MNRWLIMVWLWAGCLGPILSLGQTPLERVQTESGTVIRSGSDQPYFLELPHEEPFLRALSTKRKYKGSLGSYEVKDKVKLSLDDWAQFPEGEKLQENGSLTLTGSLKDKKGRSASTTLQFQTVSPEVLEFEIWVTGASINRLEFAFTCPPDEPVFGFGEQFSYLNRKGHQFWMLVEEQGVGRGDKGVTFWAKLAGASGSPYTTYFPVPFFFLGSQRAISLEPGGPIHFDLTDPSRVWVRSDSRKLKGRIYLGKEPLEILERYTEDAGRFPELPEWAFGTWIGVQGGREKATRIVEEALAAGNPVTGLWIQDWVGPRQTAIGTRLNWDWYPDTTLYPNLKGFCEEMDQKGVKVLGYINPFLVEDGKLCQEAMEKGYLVKDEKGEDYRLAAGGFKAYIIDLSRPEVQAWTQEIIRENLVGNGFSGWMADFGEWLPFDAKLQGGMDADSFHNQFPVAWMETNRRAIETLTQKDEIVYFSRSGYAGAGKQGKLLWAGDQMTDWGEHDGLPSAVRGILSSGMSGLTLNHSDLGGYTVIQLPFTKHTRDRELLYRWAEFAAFTPVFRTHEGLRPEANIQVYSDSGSVAFFAKMGRLHYALKEYFQEAGREAAKKGYPVIRHLWLHYPDDARVWEADQSFLIGEDVLVTPVTQAGIERIEIYLPPGDWEHLFTGVTYPGGQFNRIDVPLGRPAAFIKSDSKWKKRIQNNLKKSFFLNP